MRIGCFKDIVSGLVRNGLYNYQVGSEVSSDGYKHRQNKTKQNPTINWF